MRMMRIFSEKMKVISCLVLVAILSIKCKISVASPQYSNEHILENAPHHEDYNDPALRASYDRSFEPIIISNERLSDAQHQAWRQVVTTQNPEEEYLTTTPVDVEEFRKRRRRPGRRRKKRPNSNFLYTTTTEIPDVRQYQRRPTSETFSDSDDNYGATGHDVMGSAPPEFDSIRDKSYRKPYSVAKKEEQGSNDGVADLKHILKQAGESLSLSEILQQKNLSLSDFLNRKPTALAILAQPTQPVQQFPRRLPHVDTKNRRIAPSPAAQSPAPSSADNATDTSMETMITGDDDEKANKRFPMYMLEMPKIHDGGYNLTRDTTKSQQIPTISTAPEGFKHNRLPTREERIKPIKEVVSGIRPDFANTNIRSHNAKFPTKTTLPPPELPSSSTTSRPSQRWKPPPYDGKVISKFNERRTSTSQPEIYAEEASTENHPEIHSTPTTTTTTTASNYITPGRKQIAMRDYRNRMNLRPKLRIAIKTTPKTTTEETIIEAVKEEPEEEPQTTEMAREFVTASPTEAEISGKLLVVNHTEPETFNIIEESDQLERLEKADKEEETKEESRLKELPDEIIQSNTARSDSIFEADIIERVIQNTQRALVGSGQTRDLMKMDVTESNPSLFADISSESTVDEKTELMELLGDRRSGARLAKILAQRNMTINELIDHRERGSSQVHLAEIFHNRTLARNLHHPRLRPEKLEIVTTFENFPHFSFANLRSVKPDDIKTDSQGSSYFASIINVKPTDDTKTPKANPRASGYPTNFNPYDTSTPEKESAAPSSRVSPANANYADDGDIIEKEIARINNQLDLEIEQQHAVNRKNIVNAYLTSGVRSAIVASSCIVAGSVMIFIIIFATCRWRQRRNRKLNYSDSFSGTRGRLPILKRQTSRRASNPPEYLHTEPRLSKLNTMDSMSGDVHDYLYDAMRKGYP
ncbi:uncharacterized protein LOC129788196 [Lutzomyia longipalpis]|uniref:uncharacterized protein LOC129788196 n=1 Tax=Lutzomyia longipalpis TaxID=7200 RepID=UPI0024842604|nr:uncharacterized protein LOC129788196 [Lutzomyia longipalpis]